MRRTSLLLTLLVAGCGGAEAGPAKDAGKPEQAAWRAQAEAACVKFVRFPGYPYVTAKKKADVLEQLEWEERRTAIVTADPPAGADAAEYRRQVIEPAERVEKAIATAREKVRAGESPEYAYIDASRVRDEFEQAYITASEDLGLRKCADEHLRTGELENELKRSARFVCEDARAPFAGLRSNAPLRKLEKANDFLTEIVAELEALKPSPRLRQVWGQAVGGAKKLNHLLEELVEVSRGIVRGDDPAPLVRKGDRIADRVDGVVRRADRAFNTLHLDECADLF